MKFAWMISEVELSIYVCKLFFVILINSTKFEKSKQYRYTKVFQFLPWEDIYTSDNERYETFEQSVAISKHLYKAYESLGYEIINVPFNTVENRCHFILNAI